MPEYVKLMWSTSIKSYYVNKGYTFTMYGDEFIVKFEDVMRGSSVKVEVECSVCKEIHQVKIKSIVSKEEYTCKKCQNGKRKHNINKVYQTYIDRGMIPLFKEEDYKGALHPLPCKCKTHDTVVQFIRYNDIVYNTNGCKFCNIERRTSSKRYQIEEVYSIFINKGYIPLFTDYKNCAEKLPFLCPKHGCMEISLSTLLMNRGCNKCGYDKIAEKLKHPLEKVKKEFESRGYIPLFDNYANSHQPLPFKCANHEDKGIQYIAYNELNSGYGCYYCTDTLTVKGTKEKIFLSKKIDLFLRHTCDYWKQTIRESYDRKCPITQQKSNLHIHHIFSFKTIISHAHNMLGIEYKVNVEKYTECELLSLKEVMYYLQEKYFKLGVLIHKSVHTIFHSLYGKNTNYTDWLDFELKIETKSLPEYIRNRIEFYTVKEY